MGSRTRAFMCPRARRRVRDFRRGLVGEPRASTARDANGTMRDETLFRARATEASKSPRDDHATHARISARKKERGKERNGHSPIPSIAIPFSVISFSFSLIREEINSARKSSLTDSLLASRMTEFPVSRQAGR